MFKSFFLVILIMVKSALRLILKGIKKGKFSATYNCYSFFYNYGVDFPENFTNFFFSIGRNYALLEEMVSKYNIPTEIVFKIVYRPPPGKVSEFERNVYRKYCDDLKSKFHGYYSWHCHVGFSEESCPILGSAVYSLYFHLVNDYIYPFLSHLLKVKFHVESCTPFMVRTKNVTLFSSGVFSYRDRFSFSSNVIRFSIDCNHPYTSIRNAIRSIIHVL